MLRSINISLSFLQVIKYKYSFVAVEASVDREMLVEDVNSLCLAAATLRDVRTAFRSPMRRKNLSFSHSRVCWWYRATGSCFLGLGGFTGFRISAEMDGCSIELITSILR